MSRLDDKSGGEDLQQMNEALNRSLQVCHSIVDDFRAKLAANSNEQQSSSEGEDGGSAAL